MQPQNMKDYKALGALCLSYRAEGHRLDDHWFKHEVGCGRLPAVTLGNITYIHPADFADAFKRYRDIRTAAARVRKEVAGDLFEAKTTEKHALAAMQELAQSMATSMMRIESMIASIHDSLGCASKKSP